MLLLSASLFVRGDCRLTKLLPSLICGIVYNIAYSVFLPLALIALWAAIFRPPFHKIHVTILGLLISVVLTTFLTDVIKNSVGRPRPDLIARCKPKVGTPEHELVTIEVCTEKSHHILHDGWRSFPSGHSSLAFSGLGFLALYEQLLSENLLEVPTDRRTQVSCRPNARFTPSH